MNILKTKSKRKCNIPELKDIVIKYHDVNATQEYDNYVLSALITRSSANLSELERLTSVHRSTLEIDSFKSFYRFLVQWP